MRGIWALFIDMKGVGRPGDNDIRWVEKMILDIANTLSFLQKLCHIVPVISFESALLWVTWHV